MHAACDEPCNVSHINKGIGSDAAGNVALPKTVRLYPPTANPWKKSDQIELYFENTSGDSLGSGTASLSNAENTGQRGDPFQ